MSLFFNSWSLGVEHGDEDSVATEFQTIKVSISTHHFHTANKQMF